MNITGYTYTWAKKAILKWGRDLQPSSPWGREDGSPFSSIYALPVPNMRCTLPLFPPIHGGMVQPSSPRKPSPSGFPLGGFHSPSSASRDTWRHYNSRELFLVSPGVPRKARKHYIRHRQSNSPQSHNLPKQCDGTLCWCRQVRRQRRRWHVYLQVQMCWERGKGTTVSY